MDSLENIGEEVADTFCMEDDLTDKNFEQEIYRCQPHMDTIDRIIIRCMVLHERDVNEHPLTALIFKATGQNYTHQTVHKRIPAAARRLADLMNFPN